MMETMLRIQILLFCFMLLGFCYAATTWKPLFGGLGYTFDLKLYHLFILSTSIMLATDLVGWLFDGVPTKGIHTLLLVNHTIYYAFHILPTICFILYADLLLHRNPVRLKRWLLPLSMLTAVIALGAFASPFTGWFFQVDAQNVYSRGSHFMVFSIIQLLLLGATVIPLIGATKKVPTRIYWTLVFFPVIAFVGGLLQALFYGLVLIWPVTTVFLVAAALNIQKNQIGIDHLTGISNRLWFDEMLEQYLHAANLQQSFGCILMDLDGFKQINDNLGHDVGDQALQEMARILRHVAGPKDIVARYGGDEFAILLHDADSQYLQDLAQRLQFEVTASNQSAKRRYELSVSMGAALYDTALFCDAKAFITHLDATMYTQKRSKLGTRS